MPRSDFNSATPNSAFFWVRTAAGWSMYETRGYDFIRAVQHAIGLANRNLSGIWTQTAAEHLAIWLATQGPIGASLAAQIRADALAGTRVGKPEILGAAWTLVHANDPNHSSAWPHPDDIWIPADTIMPPMGTAPPRGSRDYDIRVTEGVTPPWGQMAPAQAAPVTPVSNVMDPITGASLGSLGQLGASVGGALATIVGTGGTTPVVQVQTPQGVRPMPISAPTIARTPMRIPWVPIAVVGGAIVLGIGAVLIIKSTRAPAPPPSRGRMSAGGTLY